MNQKQESHFQEVCDLVAKKYFCILFALYVKGMPNSINFCKGILLQVIPVRLWFHDYTKYEFVDQHNFAETW